MISFDKFSISCDKFPISFDKFPISFDKGSLHNKNGESGPNRGRGAARGPPGSKPLNRFLKIYSECPETQNKYLKYLFFRQVGLTQEFSFPLLYSFAL